MTRNEAYKLLPEGAVWSCSFGYPGEGGYVEYHRLGNDRWTISNGPYDGGGQNWTCNYEPAPITSQGSDYVGLPACLKAE